MIAQHARLARSLGDELGLPPVALDALGALLRALGRQGLARRREGEQIPLAARVIQLAEFVEVAHRDHGIDGAVRRPERARDPVRPGPGRYRPADAEKVFPGLDEVSSWEPVFDGEPALRVLSAADSTRRSQPSPARRPQVALHLGHSQAVATLAHDAAAFSTCPPESAPALPCRADRRIRAPGCVECHLGQAGAAHRRRVGTRPPRPAARGADAAPIPGAGTSSALVGQRRDVLSSGYPAGLAGAAIPPAARLLAAADGYQAMIEPRPHRPARSPARPPRNCMPTPAPGASIQCRGRGPRHRRPSSRAAGNVAGLTARRSRCSASPCAACRTSRSPPALSSRQSRRQPHRAHLHQDRGVEPGRSSAVRHAQRTPTPDGPLRRNLASLDPLNHLNVTVVGADTKHRECPATSFRSSSATRAALPRQGQRSHTPPTNLQRRPLSFGRHGATGNRRRPAASQAEGS